MPKFGTFLDAVILSLSHRCRLPIVAEVAQAYGMTTGAVLEEIARDIGGDVFLMGSAKHPLRQKVAPARPRTVVSVFKIPACLLAREMGWPEKDG